MLSTSKPEEYAATPVPTLDEWHELWRNWDIITTKVSISQMNAFSEA